MGTRPRLGQGGLLRRTLTQEHFDRFAELTGDHNPIHVDQEFAARTPFGKTVSHGMLLYRLIAAVLETRMPGPGTIQLDQVLTFFNPAFAGDELTIMAWITERDEQRATLSAVVARPDGTVVCQGQTTVLLPGISFDGGKCQPAGGRSESSRAVARAMGLEPGQKATSRRVFTEQDLQTRAELVGEARPSLPDQERVDRTAGARALVPGDLLGGMISQLLGMRLPGPGTSWLKQTLVFPTLAHVGDEITATVEVSRLRPDRQLVNLITTCTSSTGEVVADGEALVLYRGLAQRDT